MSIFFTQGPNCCAAGGMPACSRHKRWSTRWLGISNVASDQVGRGSIPEISWVVVVGRAVRAVTATSSRQEGGAKIKNGGTKGGNGGGTS